MFCIHAIALDGYCFHCTKEHAYNELERNNVHWSRMNDKTIIVYASSNGNGSHHVELDKITAFLSNSGFREFERDFDRQCGKGFAVYKESKVKE